MSVCNVKVSFIRPKYNNLYEWMKNKNNVYIGRKGIVFIDGVRFPKFDSVFANPFKLKNCGSREECIIKYEEYIRKKIIDEHLENQLLQMDGKCLGCWCHPLPCHGDVLLKLLHEYKKSS